MTAASDLLQALAARFPGVSARPAHDMAAAQVPIAQLLAVLTHLRQELGFDLLVDLTGIDGGPAASPRFTVVYHLYTTAQNRYLRVAAHCADDSSPAAPSVCQLWAGANWHEREAWDLLGIRFDGHPDLRRILMWEGYPHHPLRKEFPLAGIEGEYPAPDVVAHTGLKILPAPMAGGPFVAASGAPASEVEPKARDESWSEKRPRPTPPGA